MQGKTKQTKLWPEKFQNRHMFMKSFLVFGAFSVVGGEMQQTSRQ